MSNSPPTNHSIQHPQNTHCCCYLRQQICMLRSTILSLQKQLQLKGLSLSKASQLIQLYLQENKELQLENQELSKTIVEASKQLYSSKSIQKQQRSTYYLSSDKSQKSREEEIYREFPEYQKYIQKKYNRISAINSKIKQIQNQEKLWNIQTGYKGYDNLVLLNKVNRNSKTQGIGYYQDKSQQRLNPQTPKRLNHSHQQPSTYPSNFTKTFSKFSLQLNKNFMQQRQKS